MSAEFLTFNSSSLERSVVSVGLQNLLIHIALLPLLLPLLLLLLLLQDVRKAQSLGFAFDAGISIVEADVTKDAKWVAYCWTTIDFVVCCQGDSSDARYAVRTAALLQVPSALDQGWFAPCGPYDARVCGMPCMIQTCCAIRAHATDAASDCHDFLRISA
jgi:hypothetical protein